MKTRPLPPTEISRRKMSCVSSASIPLVFENRVDGFGTRLEDRGHSLPCRSVADDVTRSLVAQEKCERIDQDGFPGAGFAGQKIQTGRELHGHIVDDRVVFDRSSMSTGVLERIYDVNELERRIA